MKAWIKAIAPFTCAASLTLTPALGAYPKARPPEQPDQIKELLKRLYVHKVHLEHNATRLTLLEAIRIGLERNPILAKGYAQIQQGQWQAIAIQREWLPSLLAKGKDPGVLGYSLESYQSKTNHGATNSNYNNSLNGGVYLTPKVELQWTFFDPTRAPQERSSQASLKAEELLFNISARDLVLEIQKNYYTLQRYSELETLYRKIFELTQALSAIAKNRVKTNESSEGQIAQLKDLGFSLLINRIDAHEQVLKAAAALAFSLSLSPGELAMPSDPLKPDGKWDLNLEATIDQALALREEIQQSLATADSLSWSARASDSRTLPSLYLKGQWELIQDRYNEQDLSKAEATVSMIEESNMATTAGLYFNWLIFDGGINTAQATALRKKSEQAKQQAKLNRLTATNQVQSSYASYVSSLIVIDSANDQFKAARQAVADARNDFARGRTNATTVVQTMDGLRRAAENYCNAVAKHNDSVAELYRFSASWPSTALPLLQQRTQRLRRN